MEFIKARSRLDVKFQKARARPGSILKARARLGLEKSGLVPPLGPGLISGSHYRTEAQKNPGLTVAKLGEPFFKARA